MVSASPLDLATLRKVQAFRDLADVRDPELSPGNLSLLPGSSALPSAQSGDWEKQGK